MKNLKDHNDKKHKSIWLKKMFWLGFTFWKPNHVRCRNCQQKQASYIKKLTQYKQYKHVSL